MKKQNWLFGFHRGWNTTKLYDIRRFFHQPWLKKKSLLNNQDLTWKGRDTVFLFFRVSSLLSLFCNSIFSLRRCSNIRTWLFRAGGRLFWSSTGPCAFCWDGQQKTYEKHKYSIVNAIGLSHRISTTTKRHTVDGQKCCTTKDDDYPSIYRVLTIPGG